MAVIIGFSPELIYRSDVKFIIMLGTTLVFIFPLCMFKTLSGFRYLSMFTLASIAFVIVSLAIELPSYFREYYVYENVNFFTLDWNFF